MTKKNHRILSFTACLIGGILAGHQLATASTFLKLGVAELTERSDSVVVARVVGSQSSWNQRGSMIFTTVTLDVTQTIRGQASDRIEVRVPGGTVNGFTMEIDGAPQFPAAGPVVTFIGEWPDGAAKVIGYFQGTSQLTPGPGGSQVLQGGSGAGLTIQQFTDQVRQAGAR